MYVHCTVQQSEQYCPIVKVCIIRDTNPGYPISSSIDYWNEPHDCNTIAENLLLEILTIDVTTLNHNCSHNHNNHNHNNNNNELPQFCRYSAPTTANSILYLCICIFIVFNQVNGAPSGAGKWASLIKHCGMDYRSQQKITIVRTYNTICTVQTS